MKRKILIILSIILLTGCSIVRIDTSNIDNILNVILTKNNNLYNQAGQGYKYYLPGGVSYIESDELNDILYSNGTYYYLYIGVIDYYYKNKTTYKEDKDIYYSKKIDTKDGYKHSGYLEITKEDDMYYIVFVYNYAKIETMVKEDDINDTILNCSYILSTVKYNKNIINLMLEEDYFTNKTGKYDNYNTTETNEKFVIQKETEMKEG